MFQDPDPCRLPLFFTVLGKVAAFLGFLIGLLYSLYIVFTWIRFAVHFLHATFTLNCQYFKIMFALLLICGVIGAIAVFLGWISRD